MMRRLFALVSFPLLCASSVFAQIPFHNDGSSVTDYEGSAAIVTFDGQCHWPSTVNNPPIVSSGFDTPVFMHTHADLTGPMWGELGNQSITLPIAIKLFDADATVSIIQGIVYGPQGQGFLPVVMDQPGPYVGDPNGLVTYTGHMVLNLADWTADKWPAGQSNWPAVTTHGWTQVGLFTRTIVSDGSQYDNQTKMPFFSVIDPTAPETPLSESVMSALAICGNAMPANPVEASIFGLHEIEFRDQSLANVLERPFSTPQRVNVLGYNYGQDFDPSGLTGLATSDNGGVYQALYNPDLHMGVAGLVNDTILNTPFTDPLTGSQFILNVDYIDPTKCAPTSTVPLPMGLTAGQCRLSFDWDRFTGPNGFVDQAGNREPANVELKSLANFTVTLGSNPVGCDPTLCPPVPVVASPAPPPPPPPPPPAPLPPPPLFPGA